MTPERELEFLREIFRDYFKAELVHEYLYELAKDGKTDDELRQLLATDEFYVYAQQMGCIDQNWIDAVITGVRDSVNYRRTND